MTEVVSAKRFLTWTELEALTNRLVEQLRGVEFDLFLLISRGGLLLGGMLAKRLPFYDVVVACIQWYEGEQKLEQPIVRQFPAEPLLHGRRVLIIDDVWDSGDTLALVRKMCARAGAEVQVATLHFKPEHSLHEGRPDFFAEQTGSWIVYPWETQENQS